MFSVFSNDTQPMAFSILRPMLRELDDMMARELSKDGSRSLGLSCELDETDAHYVMSFDIPGVRREDLNIELDGNILSVSGERKTEGRNESRGHRKFQKSFRLPDGTLPEAITAEHKDGVLRVAVEKPAAAKKTVINITDGASVTRNGGFFKNLIGEKKAKESNEVKVGRSQSDSMSLAN